MKTAKLLKLLGAERGNVATNADAARLLKVSRQLVSRWGGEVPELYVYRLKDMRPDWFAKARK